MPGSLQTPHPLKLLSVWPDAAFHVLEDSVAALMRQGLLTCDNVNPARLAERLRPGRYHVLLWLPEQALSIPMPQRRLLTACANLTIMMPLTGATPVDVAWEELGRPVLTLPAAPLNRQTAFLAAFCTLLCDRYTVSMSLYNAWSRQMLGNGSASLHLPASDEAIWPVPTATAPTDSSTPAAPSLPQSMPAGIVIGHAVIGGGAMHIYKVSGDMVQGGDQVKITRGQTIGNLGHQGDQVAGDQVKIERRNS